MEWVKTTAKTVPEAIDLALDNLGVDESEAEIVILEEPRPGLFGRMRGTARVEARVRPKPIRPKNERNRNRRSRSDNRNRNKNRGGGQGRGAQGQRGRGRESGQDDATDRGSVATEDGGRDREDRGRDDGGGSGNRSRNRRRRRGGGGDDRGGSGGRSSSDDRGRSDRAESGRRSGNCPGGRSSESGGRSSSRGPSGEDQQSEGATVEEVATHLRTFLTDLSEAFGFDDGVTIDDSEDGTLIGRIEGRHGLLVGPKGRTLDAVQELARISCQRTAPSSVRIKVDVGGYRAQRAEALADFAAKAADRAVDEGTEVALEPMSPADRKSVHDALNGDDRVETRSVGVEPRRRVVVVPLESSDADDDGVDGGGDDTEDDAADQRLPEVDEGADDRAEVDDEE